MNNEKLHTQPTHETQPEAHFDFEAIAELQNGELIDQLDQDARQLLGGHVKNSDGIASFLYNTSSLPRNPEGAFEKATHQIGDIITLSKPGHDGEGNYTNENNRVALTLTPEGLAEWKKGESWRKIGSAVHMAMIPTRGGNDRTFYNQDISRTNQARYLYEQGLAVSTTEEEMIQAAERLEAASQEQ